MSGETRLGDKEVAVAKTSAKDKASRETSSGGEGGRLLEISNRIVVNIEKEEPLIRQAKPPFKKSKQDLRMPNSISPRIPNFPQDHCLILVGAGTWAEELLARRRLKAGGRLTHFLVQEAQVRVHLGGGCCTGKVRGVSGGSFCTKYIPYVSRVFLARGEYV